MSIHEQRGHVIFFHNARCVAGGGTCMKALKGWVWPCFGPMFSQYPLILWNCMLKMCNLTFDFARTFNVEIVLSPRRDFELWVFKNS